MSGAQTEAKPAAAETTESASFLDQVVAATKQTTPDQTQDLVKNLVEQALAGTVTFDKNLTRTFDRAIAAIDRRLSDQLNAVMHNSRARGVDCIIW
jgi:type VI secretion system protein ImpC